MSNVLGTIVDIKAITAGAHAAGVPVLVDGSQAAVHMAVNVRDLDVDFYAITGHKLYGPTGSGALYAKREHLERMRPFLGGGDMIREVRKDGDHLRRPAAALRGGHALDRLDHRPRGGARLHDRASASTKSPPTRRVLRDYAAQRLSGLNWLNLQGTAPGQGGDLLLHPRWRRAPARHLDRGRPQGRRRPRRPPLRPAADDPPRAHRDLPGLLRPLQHRRPRSTCWWTRSRPATSSSPERLRRLLGLIRGAACGLKARTSRSRA